MRSRSIGDAQPHRRRVGGAAGQRRRRLAEEEPEERAGDERHQHRPLGDLRPGGVLVAVMPDEAVGGRDAGGKRALAGGAVAEAVGDAVALDRDDVGGQARKGGQRVAAPVRLLQREADVVAGLAWQEERLAFAEEADEAHRDGQAVHRKAMGGVLLVDHRRGDGEEVVVGAEQVVDGEADARADGGRVDEAGAGEELAGLAGDAQVRGQASRAVVEDGDLRRLDGGEEEGGEQLAQAVVADAAAVGIELVGALEVGVDEAASKRRVDPRGALVLDDEAHAAVRQPPVPDFPDRPRPSDQLRARLHLPRIRMRPRAAGSNSQDQGEEPP